MHMTHIIIDDFFDNPHEVRNQVLELSYPTRQKNAYYPGRNAANSLEIPGIEQLIGKIVHEPLCPAPETSHSIPRLAMAGDQSRASVHFDTCHWSAMIYLSLDKDCQGGTHFFRHKRTGWDMAPVWPGMAQKEGYTNPAEAIGAIIKEDGNDRSKWDETMTIEMKFNRLAIFRGYLWHDAGISFGETPETARLIIPLFFKNVNPQQ